MSARESIRTIIADMRDRTGGVYLCPACGGGRSNERSLNIHLRDGVWLWFCHRGSCAEKGAIAAGGELRGRSAPDFQPRPFSLAYRLPNWIQDKDPIADRIHKVMPGVSAVDFAVRHGLRVMVADNATHLWELYNVRGQRIGHVTRNEQKFIRTWRVHPGPFYGYFGPVQVDHDNLGPVVIVEDPMSAALLAETGLRAIALLGTNLSPEAAQEITSGLPRDTFYVVALDNDRAGVLSAPRVVSRLQALNVKVARWMLPADVKNMRPHERLTFARQVREAVQ